VAQINHFNDLKRYGTGHHKKAMTVKLYSDLKIWISIYGAPVGLFMVGTIFGPGVLRTKLEVYSIAFLGALSLAIISRYSTYFLLEGKRAMLSALFIRREIDVGDVSEARSIHIPVFGANVESIELKMKNGQRVGIYSLPYNKKTFGEIKKILNLQA
jgi:hypothetical protein